jgi:hypothetical protein
LCGESGGCNRGGGAGEQKLVHGKCPPCRSGKAKPAKLYVA